MLDLCEFQVQPFPKIHVAKSPAWYTFGLAAWMTYEEADIKDCGWYGVGRPYSKIWNMTDFPT